jgi:hypothetical protein
MAPITGDEIVAVETRQEIPRGLLKVIHQSTHPCDSLDMFYYTISTLLTKPGAAQAVVKTCLTPVFQLPTWVLMKKKFPGIDAYAKSLAYYERLLNKPFGSSTAKKIVDAVAEAVMLSRTLLVKDAEELNHGISLVNFKEFWGTCITYDS